MRGKKSKLVFFPGAILAILSEMSSAHIENAVKLKLSFDQYATPHTTFLINGDPVYAMIDTGSMFGFHLREEQLNKIKGLKKERTYRSTDGKGKVQENTEYRVDSLDVNGMKLKNVRLTPFKKWGLMVFGQGELPNNPVAGLDAFKNKQVLFDYADNLLVISDDINVSSYINDAVAEFPLQMSADGIVFDVVLAGKTYRLILDTGATVSVLWQERIKSFTPASCLLVDPQMDNEGCVATRLAITSGNGKSETFGAVVVAGDFKHMGSIDGLLGNNFLRHRKMLIDFKNQKVFISNEYRK